MALTDAQNTALKADIIANTDQVVIDALASGAHNQIAAWYNGTASPDFYCWRSSMTVGEIRELVDWDEVVGQNTNTLLSFQVLTSEDSVNPANTSVRNAFAAIFSGPGGVNSRTALNDGAKRTVTEGEKALHAATGAGTEGDPSTFGFEGTLSSRDITGALNS